MMLCLLAVSNQMVELINHAVCKAADGPRGTGRIFQLTPTLTATRHPQAISSTTPFFTAAFAFVILSKRESFLVYCSLVPVVLGVVIASGFEPSFDMYGFIACVCSTAARALKSVMGAAL